MPKKYIMEYEKNVQVENYRSFQDLSTSIKSSQFQVQGQTLW